MKKYFSRLLVLLIAFTSFSTVSHTNNKDDLFDLYKFKILLEQYNKLDKKEEKKSPSFYQKTLKQTSSLTKKWAGLMLPYAVLATGVSLTANNLAYSFLPSWLVSVRPYSLADVILSPQALGLWFLLMQDDEKK